MRVLQVAAEIFPLVKTGGLADVLGALPQALQAHGADVRLLLPGFPAIMDGLAQARPVCELGNAFGAARVRLHRGVIEASGVAAYVIEAPILYQRAGNPYLDAQGRDWADNLQRFALLGWVGAQLAGGALDSEWSAQVLHAHDWHAALACAWLAAQPGQRARSVFTVHNLAYQGLFDARDFHLLGLPAAYMTPQGLEYHGQLSFMKAGLAFAHRVTTVSPTYAREIATEEFGCGLDGLIRARGADVSGVLNGVDGAVWNPQAYAATVAPYSGTDLQGKARCKAALQQSLGLRSDPAAPLLSIVSRLNAQKGIDLLLQALPALLAQGAQLALQGTGDAALEAALAEAARQHRAQVAVRLAYDEAGAHQMIAGADMILVPSRFEPCGLTQLYGLRYGTVPVVRHVGGLADTVVDTHAATLTEHRATGFVFGPPSADALVAALERAIRLYREPLPWRALMQRGMAQDFSWEPAARAHVALYRAVCGGQDPGI